MKMFRRIVKRTAFVLSGSAVVVNSVDTNNEDSQGKIWYNLLPSFFSKNESQSDVTSKDKQTLTGWDRLYIMYTKDEFGHPSKELNTLFYCTYTSFFVGSIYGVVTKTKKAHDEFLKRNQASQFANVFEARRAMQDKVMMAAFKGLFQQGCRLAFFCGGIMTIIISSMVYFNSTSIIHYGVATGTCGAIHRWKMGPRGMFAGGVVGGLLGLLGGSMTKGLFYMSGVNMNDVISYQDDVMRGREKTWKEMQEKTIEEKIKLSFLLKEHEEITNENEINTTDEKKEHEKTS